jgi:Mn-dependent DtxR family transcriptional regulator
MLLVKHKIYRKYGDRMDNEFYTVRGYELKSYHEKSITSAMEDYMEMIYRHSLKEDYIRINQLSKLLNVKNSSASKMVQKLALYELLNYERYGIITLTDKGKILGSFLYKRHNIIEEFLSFLDCSEDVLAQTELIEHIIADDTVKRIAILHNFFKENKEVLKKYIEFRNKKNKKKE